MEELKKTIHLTETEKRFLRYALLIVACVAGIIIVPRLMATAELAAISGYFYLKARVTDKEKEEPNE